MENRSKRRSAKDAIPDVTEGTSKPVVEKKLEHRRGEVLPCMLSRAQVGAQRGYDNKTTPIARQRFPLEITRKRSKMCTPPKAGAPYEVEVAQQ